MPRQYKQIHFVLGQICMYVYMYIVAYIAARIYRGWHESQECAIFKLR